MLTNLVEYLRPSRLRSTTALRRFVSGEASYLVQRATYEFSRNTLAWYGQHAFADREFNDRFRVCRWEGYAGLVEVFCVLVRARLGRAPAGGDLDAAMVVAAASMLGEYETPGHRAAWDDVLASLSARLALRSPDAPPAPVALGAEVADRIVPVLPVQSSNRKEDREVLANAFGFGTIAFNDRLAARLDAPALAADLLRQAG
jgi:hypothetical protein